MAFCVNGTEGVKVAVETVALPLVVRFTVMMPATWTLPLLTVKVLPVMVAGSIGSLNVAVMAVLRETPAAPLAGLTDVTEGAVASVVVPVVKVQLKGAARGVPVVSFAPVVMVAV